jgi:hypothetical protein
MSDSGHGVDAEKRVRQAEATRASEAEKWRHLTLSTVFEDAESIPELLNHQRGKLKALPRVDCLTLGPSAEAVRA